MRRARARRICCIVHPQRQAHHPISHFFNKKIWQSTNYNKNGCKFAKRVNTKEYYILY